ncbi:histidinol phosphate aminotransferase apoenzyme [Nitrosococcus oceani ATCC 19707]|uniref:Histidinol-phosphate aminotransferase 2 n=2 Tax=Nitrosococcus oceani TaxID=1229 RepID=HIS82_NITOC|nr:histidinol-phosphate transaminase [Nitrosococcus oceani]Q3J7H2.1 RecName: Full=Histidinol-phosphate aminotransferase 2; AltName: Full=Imidazole acetol-phosphate transaminase 2 [Nitrosococcus oceani ATCC 19707]KFI18252.1 histidinol-phosphate aminotransferase [Nitrosococcus oceani C-27]ABA59224.1 histidinol phosphate aminotransferase apoenzyme [Nitrosococcus oceani ATCC 19707]EDZ66247.1 histidinol-phosphate aminotransferase [Nitrosococcus oceani AFC27]GEM21049.1 histidinol-phosphate aminotran
MTKDRVAQWIRPEIQRLSAYRVADAADLIKLDAMENPYTWSPELIEAWLERLRQVSVNRYPDPQARSLKLRLRQYLALPEDMEMILGNGSDELIQMVLLAVAGPGRSVVAPEPTFVMYRQIAALLGLQYQGVALREDFSLDLPAMLQVIRERVPAVVFIAYPNNPTGNLFSAEELQAIIEASPGLVIVDEAYSVFAGETFMPRLEDYDHLLVMRTLSKIGLAGLRLGMLMGNPAWIKELEKVRLPYNINQLTQVSAEFALEQPGGLDEQARLICKARAQLQRALQQLPGIQVYPSDANFILFRTPPHQAEAIFTAIKERGVLIKNLSGQGGLLTDCLRVTVGTADENHAFLKALKAGRKN